MSSEEKLIIVTGGCGDLGSSIVRKLIENNYKVAAFDINEQKLKEITAESSNIIGVQCDITNNEDVAEKVAKLEVDHGKIHGLVNNAGILFSSPLVSFSFQTGIVKHSVEDWKKVIDINLNAVFYMTSAVVECMMKKRTKGTIVNISSISSNGNPGQSAYSATKAALNALTNTWSKELGSMGIRTVGVAPGFINTESTSKAISQEVMNDIKSRVPLKRLGVDDHISSTVLFALENSYLNGTTIEVDGGLTI